MSKVYNVDFKERRLVSIVEDKTQKSYDIEPEEVDAVAAAIKPLDGKSFEECIQILAYIAMYVDELSLLDGYWHWNGQPVSLEKAQALERILPKMRATLNIMDDLGIVLLNTYKNSIDVKKASGDDGGGGGSVA